jgi:DNA topoisomerase-3
MYSIHTPPALRHKVTKATLKADCDEIFTMAGRKLVEPGFLAVYHQTSREPDPEEGEEEGAAGSGSEEMELPTLEKGQVYRLALLKMREGRTSAPGYLTESELIGQMEKHGIGTDASIPTHINNITVRNYVTLGSGRTLIPTALGTVLVHGYLAIDADLVLPDVRSAIESFCDMVAQGTAVKEEVVQHSLRNFEAKFAYFVSKIQAMDNLFEASFSPLAASGKFLSKCGKCLRYMRFIPLMPQRLYCPTCEQTHSLPQHGTIKLYKELRCPLDNFELVLFSLGNASAAQGKSYPLCPCCYNNPPKIDIEDAIHGGGGTRDKANSKSESVGLKLQPVSRGEPMGCNSCLHPTCQHSAVRNSMCECPTMDDNGQPCKGTLVLDVNSRPNWKLCCNRCNTLLKFHAEINTITPLAGRSCEECGQHIATFEFLKGGSPLPSGELVATGCVMCDDSLNEITEITTGRKVHLKVVRQKRTMNAARGGRGGRGRGGRGGKREKNPLMSFSDF